MSVKLTTNLSQRLVLTPQLRQRIEMLQMTSLELSELIQQQLEENPILEEVASQDERREIETEIIDQLAGNDAPALTGADLAESLNGASGNGAGDTEVLAEAFGEGAAAAETSPVETAGEDLVEHAEPSSDPFEEIDFGREFQDYLDPGYKTQEYEYKDDQPTFEQFLTRPESLSEHLTWQLHMTHVEGVLVDIAEAIIGNLDGDGRLNATNEEIAALGGWTEEQVEEARQIVLRLDPIGCGARDARECLLVQLDVRGESDRLACRVIREHALADLQQHKLPNLAKALGVTIEALVEEMK
ncbi:MAG TPA: hypothetical protein VGV38_06005, partial [Pyrinomonadaceae bacterium]|nr:hypothetical protein [Pyrinomonadaceae bacterium]